MAAGATENQGLWPPGNGGCARHFLSLGDAPLRVLGFASLALPIWKSNTHSFADDSGKVHALQVTSQFRMNLGTNSACSQSISQEMNCRQLSASFCCHMERHQLPMKFYDRLRLRGIIAGEDVSWPGRTAIRQMPATCECQLLKELQWQPKNTARYIIN